MNFDLMRSGWRRAASFQDRLGNCYEYAARYVQDHGGTLVHGSIEGFGHPRIDHAWVEKPDGTAHDAVLDQDFDAMAWRLLFKPEVAHRYSQEEVFVNLVRHEHWGPWDDHTAALSPVGTDDFILDYTYGGTPVRLGIHDPDAEPRDDHYHPGDLVAFIDVFLQPDTIGIAYMSVRRDYRGQGLGRRLVQAVYDRWPDKKVDWGKVMEPEAGSLWKDFSKRYPDRGNWGSQWYR